MLFSRCFMNESNECINVFAKKNNNEYISQNFKVLVSFLLNREMLSGIFKLAVK